MFKTFSQSLVFTLISLWSALALAASPSDKAVAELLELSGLSKQIVEFPNAMKSGISQAGQQGQIPPNVASQMQQQIDIGLNEQRMLQGIQETVKSSLNAQEVSQLLNWYRSETGKRITAEEAKASTPQAQQEMMAKAQQLMQDQARVTQAQRINKAAGITEVTMEMQKQVSIAIFAGLSRAMQPQQEPDIAVFKSQMAQMEPQLRQQLDQFVTLALVYTYRDLQPQTMQSYEHFLSQPATQKFNRTVIGSISQNVEQVVLRWAANMTVAAR